MKMIKFLKKALWASLLFSIPLYFISVFAFYRETQIEIIAIINEFGFLLPVLVFHYCIIGAFAFSVLMKKIDFVERYCVWIAIIILGVLTIFPSLILSQFALFGFPTTCEKIFYTDAENFERIKSKLPSKIKISDMKVVIDFGPIYILGQTPQRIYWLDEIDRNSKKYTVLRHFPSQDVFFTDTLTQSGQ